MTTPAHLGVGEGDRDHDGGVRDDGVGVGWSPPPRHELTLPDGRRLAWYEVGDRDGHPVVHNHGGLVSALDVALADEAANRLGIRILAPDRPGIGGSEARPGRTLPDWPDDVAALLDDQGIERCGVIGWSLGGQYALACGWRLADRVERIALVAGCPPLDDRTRRAELVGADARFATWAQHRPRLAAATFAAMGRTARLAPSVFAVSGARVLPAPDAAVVRRSPAWFAAMSAPALLRAHGQVTEYRVMVQPWGFRPDDVGMPVDVWQGTADTLVPERWGRELAASLPAATLHLVPGAGHFVAFDRWDEVLGRLLPE